MRLGMDGLLSLFGDYFAPKTFITYLYIG